MKEIKAELAKCYSDVDKYYQENVKLAEHNKTLEQVLKVNTELHDQLKKIEEKLAEDEVLVIEETTKDKANTGATPQKTATHPCNKCDFNGHTAGLLRRHLKQKHTNQGPQQNGTKRGPEDQDGLTKGNGNKGRM